MARWNSFLESVDIKAPPSLLAVWDIVILLEVNAMYICTFMLQFDIWHFETYILHSQTAILQAGWKEISEKNIIGHFKLFGYNVKAFN